MGDPSTSSIFHVIGVRTSYKLFLEHLWLHEHEIVALTLYQCLRYHHGGNRKVRSDVRSFTKAESHFANYKFFKEVLAPKEMTTSIISSTSKNGSKAIKDTPLVIGHNGTKQQRYGEGDKHVGEILYTNGTGFEFTNRIAKEGNRPFHGHKRRC